MLCYSTKIPAQRYLRGKKGSSLLVIVVVPERCEYDRFSVPSGYPQLLYTVIIIICPPLLAWSVLEQVQISLHVTIATS